jgi:hypothetical protein
MEKRIIKLSLLTLILLSLFTVIQNVSAEPSTLDCKLCHNDVYTKWQNSPHAMTQVDVATELAASRVTQTPDDVIHGDDAEDCIACHAPTAVLANGGMDETQAMNYFFTTTDGKYTENTAATHTSDWPSVSCITCHDVPSDHPNSMPKLASYNSQTGSYDQVNSVSDLCGQCHGNLRFPNTDHQTYNAWMTSKHSMTQVDVATELAGEHAGQTPNEVIKDENCIACHAPTAVLANGGMDETQAMNYFFTTTDGKYTENTAATHTSDWPSVSCITCHDPHTPSTPSYFESTTGKYIPMTNTSELCGQCHGNLRFPGTDHLSYNILTGTGGVGVPDRKTMPDATCIDCHMYVSNVDGSNSAMYHGHSWAITVQEDNGQYTVSCTNCHTTIDEKAANNYIEEFRSQFEAVGLSANIGVNSTAGLMKNVVNATLQNMLLDAQNNLAYAESDESNGFHNHEYLISLLQNANTKALEVQVAYLQTANKHLEALNNSLLSQVNSLESQVKDLQTQVTDLQNKGIPGFPVSSIALGLLASAVILFYISKPKPIN